MNNTTLTKYTENNLNQNNSNQNNSNSNQNSNLNSHGKLVNYDNFKDNYDGNDTDNLVIELSRQQQDMRNDFELRLQTMETESARVIGENLLLKQLILDARQKQALMQDKMEKVLKTLYNVFMGGGNSNPLSILNNSDNYTDFHSNNTLLNSNINSNLNSNLNTNPNSNSNNLHLVSTESENSNNSSLVPVPNRSSLAPQMLESLIFRLDSLQTLGVR